MNTITLYGGSTFDFAKPTENDVPVETIAHGLAGERRYANQLDLREANGPRVLYSVAEHSVHVLRLIRSVAFATEMGVFIGRNDEVWALAHDAPEAVMRDIPSPLKQLLPDYKRIELLVMQSMKKTFDLTGPEPRMVKVADRLIGEAERYFFRGDPAPPAWVLENFHPMCWPADLAKARFLDEWEQLK